MNEFVVGISADLSITPLKLSIVMPCYKGEAFIANSIKTTMAEVSKFLKGFELIVVVDGFLDETYEISKSLETEYPNLKTIGYSRNMGKGHAIKTGVLESTGERVALLDSDLDYHPKALKTFHDVACRDQADFVVGNRRDRLSVSRYPFIRKIASYCFNIFVKLLFPSLKIHDTQAGIKLIGTAEIKTMLRFIDEQESAKGFIFDLYLLLLARKMKLKIAEAPCIFCNKTTTIGTGVGFLRMAMRMGKEVWDLRKIIKVMSCKLEEHGLAS